MHESCHPVTRIMSTRETAMENNFCISCFALGESIYRENFCIEGNVFKLHSYFYFMCVIDFNRNRKDYDPYCNWKGLKSDLSMQSWLLHLSHPCQSSEHSVYTATATTSTMEKCLHCTPSKDNSSSKNSSWVAYKLDYCMELIPLHWPSSPPSTELGFIHLALLLTDVFHLRMLFILHGPQC